MNNWGPCSTSSAAPLAGATDKACKAADAVEFDSCRPPVRGCAYAADKISRDACRRWFGGRACWNLL